MDSNIPSSLDIAARRAALLRDLRAFLLAALAAFLVVVGGGWWLGEQVAAPPDDILSSEIEQVGAAAGPAPAISPVAAPPAPHEEWRVFIYTGPPLPPTYDDDLEHARVWDARDEG